MLNRLKEWWCTKYHTLETVYGDGFWIVVCRDCDLIHCVGEIGETCPEHNH